MGWGKRTGHKGESKPPNDEMVLAMDTQQLRFLARDVVDEAHLQRILETVPDGAMRIEIERLLRPMLLFKAPEVGTVEAGEAMFDTVGGNDLTSIREFVEKRNDEQA